MAVRMKFTNTEILRELESPERAPLRRLFSERAYVRRQLISLPYHSENKVFIVVSGRVRVFLAHEDKELTVSILKPGDIYATHTPAYVQAVKASVILEAGADAFRRCLEEFPELTYGMIQVLGNLLRNAFSIIQNLAFKDTRRRITEFFLHEARKGGAEKGQALVEAGLTVEDIAAVVGATRQTVSTLVNEMVREGLLAKRGRGTYLVPDVALLEQRR